MPSPHTTHSSMKKNAEKTAKSKTNTKRRATDHPAVPQNNNSPDDSADSLRDSQRHFPPQLRGGMTPKEGSVPPVESEDDYVSKTAVETATQPRTRGAGWLSWHDRELAKLVHEHKPFRREVDEKWATVASALTEATAGSQHPLTNLTGTSCKLWFNKLQKDFKVRSHPLFIHI